MVKKETVYKNIFYVPDYKPRNDIKRIIIENLSDVKLKNATILYLCLEDTNWYFNWKKFRFEKKKYNYWVNASFNYSEEYTEVYIKKIIYNPIMWSDDIITHHMFDDYNNLCLKPRVVINGKYTAFFSSFVKAQNFYEEIKEHLGEAIIIENNYEEKWQE